MSYLDENQSQHPQHKHSKYIDNDFSFSNQVCDESARVNYLDKVSMVDALKNMRCDGGIMLEPRLQEYLKKKKYYKDNNIEPCISIEKEYLITGRDKKFLKEFIKGRRDMYKRENKQLKSERRHKPQPKRSFPSKQFRNNDPRVPELKNNTHEMPLNRGMFVPEGEDELYYEDPIRKVDAIMDARDLKSSTDEYNHKDPYNSYGFRYDKGGQQGFDLDNNRFDPRSDPRMYPGIEKQKQDKYKSQYRTSPPPDHSQGTESLDKYFTQRILGDSKEKAKLNKITEDDLFSTEYGRFKNFDVMEAHDYTFLGEKERKRSKRPNAIYGECDRPSFSEKSDMDLDNKVVVPNMSSRDKRELSTFDYRMGQYDTSDMQFRNTELETNMVRGMPDATKKSYGYRNPAEHYYQYIDEDFQNPDNSDLPFARGGESTRRSNKGLARQKYVREIM